MSHFVGLDVSQKMTAICVVDKAVGEYGEVSALRFQNISASKWFASMRGVRAPHLRRSCFEPDVAAGYLDREENRDPGRQ